MTESSSLPTAATLSAICPVTHGFTPFASDYLADPYPFFNALREQTPVAYSPEYDLYLVTRFDDIVAVLKNRDVFSAANSTIPFGKIAPPAASILAGGFPRKPTLTNADPPRHTAMRSAASKCLTPRRWKSVQPVIASFVEAQIAGVKGRETIDLATDVIYPTTSYAGFALLGFPPEDNAMLFSWCGKRVLMTYGELDEADQVIAAQQMVDFWDYCREFVRKREREPVDDLTSDLLAVAKASDGKVTLEDVDNMVYALSLASHETTANAMLNGFHRLMMNRHAWDDLVSDRSLIPGAVEEMMRFDSPTITHRRLTRVHTELGGVPDPGGGDGYADPGRWQPRSGAFPRSRDLRHPTHECHRTPGVWQELALLPRRTARAIRDGRDAGRHAECHA